MKKLHLDAHTPYELFQGDNREFTKFLDKCQDCVTPTEKCKTFEVMLKSIASDKKARWTEEDVDVSTGVPVCKHHKERDYDD